MWVVGEGGVMRMGIVVNGGKGMVMAWSYVARVGCAEKWWWRISGMSDLRRVF